MNTTKEDITKLNEASQKRDEAKVYLSKYFLVNQDSVSQNLLRRWKNFEQLEEEVKAEEAEEINPLEREISERQKIEGQNLKFINLWKHCLVLTLLITFTDLGMRLTLAEISEYPPPPELNRCTTGWLAGC